MLVPKVCALYEMHVRFLSPITVSIEVVYQVIILVLNATIGPCEFVVLAGTSHCA